MEFEEHLRELGFSQNESRVYLALLELGCCNVGKIAVKSRVHRTNVYDSLEGLSRKGLVSSVLKGKIKFYEAVNPECLLTLVREKEAKVMELIPKLKERHTIKEEIARTYEGVQAFRTILNSWLEKKESIFTYGIPKDTVKSIGPFINHFHKRRIKKKIIMKHIYNENAKERITYLNKLPYTEAKFLPEDFDTDSNTALCGDEIMIIHWKKNPFIIHLKQKELADTYRKYFEFLYKKARA